MCRFLEQPDLGHCQAGVMYTLQLGTYSSLSLIAFSHLSLSISLKGDLPYNPILEREVHTPTFTFQVGTGCTSFPKQLLQQTSLILFFFVFNNVIFSCAIIQKRYYKGSNFYCLFETLLIYIMMIVWLGFQVNFRSACAAALYFFKF